MINYDFDFWANVNAINNIFVAFLYVVLLYLIVAGLVKKRFGTAFVLIVIFSVVIGLDVKFTRERFVKLDPDRLEITQLNGDVVKINVNDVERFWGINESSKGVRTGCYLWIESRTDDFRSVTTENKYKCGSDAKYLNAKFHKY